MDAGVWIGAVAGLAGALVGAGGSIATTLVTQRHQKAEARREERARLARETVDTITQELIALRELAWTYPAEDASEEVMRPFRLTANAHHQRIEVTLVRLPDRALGERLGDVLMASRLAFQGSEGSHSNRKQGAFSITYEGLSCLGAFLREEPLPPLTVYTQQARARRLQHQEGLPSNAGPAVGHAQERADAQ